MDQRRGLIAPWILLLFANIYLFVIGKSGINQGCNKASSSDWSWPSLIDFQLSAGSLKLSSLSLPMTPPFDVSSASEMIPLIVASYLLALGLPLYAAPLTQTSSSASLVYDAVVLGSNDIVELMPATSGLPIPVSTLMNVDIESCGSNAVCIKDAFTDSASHVVSSVVAEFNVLSTSIVTAIEDVVDAIEAGVEAGKASSNTNDDGLLVSPTTNLTRQTGTTGWDYRQRVSFSGFVLSIGSVKWNATGTEHYTGLSDRNMVICTHLHLLLRNSSYKISQGWF